MPLYKAILKPRDVEGHILDYKPKAINHPMAPEAIEFIKEQEVEVKPPFEISPLVAQTTGISEIEKKNFAARVESEVLSRLKAIEEKSYAEAYALGMQDGKNKAYEDTSKEIADAVKKLGEIAERVSQIKKQLLIENEAHLIKTLFHFAKALALKEISQDPSLILNVLRSTLESAQADEEIKIRLNTEDQKFLESIKGKTGNPWEKLPKLKVEANETIARGGCIIETNYGVVDASIETRVAKLYEILESKIPKVTENS